MSLEQIRDELYRISEELFYGEIEFSYDAMGFTMAFSHPAELLGDMCGDLDAMLEYNSPVPEELEMLLGGASVAFERLPMVQDEAILRNILYSGLWQGYDECLRRREKARMKKMNDTVENKESEVDGHGDQSPSAAGRI